MTRILIAGCTLTALVGLLAWRLLPDPLPAEWTPGSAHSSSLCLFPGFRQLRVIRVTRWQKASLLPNSDTACISTSASAAMAKSPVRTVISQKITSPMTGLSQWAPRRASDTRLPSLGSPTAPGFTGTAGKIHSGPRPSPRSKPVMNTIWIDCR